MVLFSDDGAVLVAERNDLEEPAWQLPQGGMDGDESPRTAARRELSEEIGTADVAFLDEADDWVDYDLPVTPGRNPWQGRYRGQRVKLIAFQFAGKDADIDLATPSPEFRAWKWVELETLPNLIVPFKKSLYEAAVKRFKPLRDRLRERR